jgi:hypothetical protein
MAFWVFYCTLVAHDPGTANLRAENVGVRIACRVVKAN